MFVSPIFKLQDIVREPEALKNNVKMTNVEETKNEKLIEDLTEKLKGLTYANAIQTLGYVKRNLERVLVLS